MRKISAIIVLIFIVELLYLPVHAETYSANSFELNSVTRTQTSIDSIFREYDRQIEMTNSQSGLTVNERQARQSSSRSQRFNSLEENGYTAFRVNSANYISTGQALDSDLAAIGLNPDGSYLIVVGGEQQTVLPTFDSSLSMSTSDLHNAPSSNSFIYTYNGVMYVMRYLYVTADCYEATSGYAQASTKNLLTSSSQSAINNLLNSALNAYVSYYSASLGFILSVIGLDITQYGYAGSSTFYLNAGTNWSRVFTQVYDTYDQAWQFCSSVEKVHTTAYMSGMYYSATQNAMVPIPQNVVGSYIDSQQYNNFTWRKQQAIIAYLSGSLCTYDMTGSIKYRVDGVVRITHIEPA